MDFIGPERVSISAPTSASTMISGGPKIKTCSLASTRREGIGCANRVRNTRDLRRSKTDQEGTGRKIGIPFGLNPQTCPVRSLRAWMEAATIGIGPLFRSVNRHGQLQRGRLCDKAVALTVKRYAKAIGLDVAKYSAHSLRAGLVTSAAIAGVSDRAIMQQTGHKSHAMLMRYSGDSILFRENAAAKGGL